MRQIRHIKKGIYCYAVVRVIVHAPVIIYLDPPTESSHDWYLKAENPYNPDAKITLSNTDWSLLHTYYPGDACTRIVPALIEGTYTPLSERYIVNLVKYVL